MKVWAATEEKRKFLRHPSGVRFREDISRGVEWPDDQFTKRRIRDGDVVTQCPVREKKPVTKSSLKIEGTT